jgi:hypothetical protein
VKRCLPSRETLRRLLDYDQHTGELRWRARGDPKFDGKLAGKRAFVRLDGQGYHSGRCPDIGTERAHRVIWKWMTGRDANVIDHINGDRADNRWSNLRGVDWTGNSTNSAMNSRNTSGRTGVWRDGNRWNAEIKYRGVKRTLGGFITFEEAVAAREDAERRLGFHPNHGRRMSLERGA